MSYRGQIPDLIREIGSVQTMQSNCTVILLTTKNIADLF